MKGKRWVLTLFKKVVQIKKLPRGPFPFESCERRFKMCKGRAPGVTSLFEPIFPQSHISVIGPIEMMRSRLLFASAATDRRSEHVFYKVL